MDENVLLQFIPLSRYHPSRVAVDRNRIAQRWASGYHRAQKHPIAGDHYAFAMADFTF